MIELKVLTLIVAGPQSPSFLVLEPDEPHAVEGKSRVVPICIGQAEALSMGLTIEKARLSRPMTHDLMLDALTNLDAVVDHVFICDVKGGTFFARLRLAQHDRIIDLDARPSDGISLALRQGAPIYIDEGVLERSSFPYLFRKKFDEEAAVADFQDFLKDLSPDDFAE